MIENHKGWRRGYLDGVDVKGILKLKSKEWETANCAKGRKVFQVKGIEYRNSSLAFLSEIRKGQ